MAAILLFAIDAFACQIDRDCPPTSRCVRSWGRIEGICQRGIAPDPGEEPRRIGEEGPKAREGEQCEMTIDCAPGLLCTIERDSSLSVCVRR
jgi:hypothetical protein